MALTAYPLSRLRRRPLGPRSAPTRPRASGIGRHWQGNGTVDALDVKADALAVLLAAAAKVRDAGGRSRSMKGAKTLPAWPGREALYAERLGLTEAQRPGKSPRRR